VVARLALVLAAAGAGWSSGACTRCDVDCTAPARVEEVVAEVRSTDPGVVHVRTEGGEALDIRIFGGSPDDLDRGTSYRFPLLYVDADLVVAPGATATTAAPPDAPIPPEVAVAQPAAFFPDDCDCTSAYISDLDGEVIDPGVDIPFRRLAVAFLAGSFLLVVAWALSRWYREVPL
jgi:hypothetical protein